MRLFAHWQQLHQRPHGDPLDVVLSALVSENSHAYWLRLHTLEGFNGSPDGFAHSENGVHNQHLLTLDSGETWVYRPSNFLLPQPLGEKKVAGAVNPSFSAVEGKKVLIVDTILRMGETIRAAVETLQTVKSKPVGVTVLANKSGKDSIEGIPIRSLVELLPVAKQPHA